jgi:hypothetical protein
LHEFKDSDDARHDPKPELSIYLPDAVIGQPSGEKFNVKGKDRSKTMSSKLTGSAELSFKAHTPADALRWFEIIRGVAGAAGPAATSSVAGSDEDLADTAAAQNEPEKEAVAGTTASTATSPTADSNPTKTTEYKAQDAGVTEHTSPAAAAETTLPVHSKETAPAATSTTAPATTSTTDHAAEEKKSVVAV